MDKAESSESSQQKQEVAGVFGRGAATYDQVLAAVFFPFWTPTGGDWPRFPMVPVFWILPLAEAQCFFQSAEAVGPQGHVTESICQRKWCRRPAG